ncbi:DUF3885 domain-containing protein [Streptomyces chartreusis]|uniref:DUF3885 domain-containing protein n=1 Tax=Streptomyces chartreusis TaxID=1969 RepID=UPI0037CE95DD
MDGVLLTDRLSTRFEANWDLRDAQYADFVAAHGRDLYDCPEYETLRGIQEFGMTTWLMQSVQEDEETAAEYRRRIAGLRNDDAPRDWRLWNRGCLDGLLQAVTDQALVEVFIADTELQRIHHPYDGGADVMLATLQSVTVCVTNSHDQGVRQVECGRIRNHRGSRACGLRLRTPPSTAREPRASRQGSLTPSRSDNRPPTRA